MMIEPTTLSLRSQSNGRDGRRVLDDRVIERIAIIEHVREPGDRAVDR